MMQKVAGSSLTLAGSLETPPVHPAASTVACNNSQWQRQRYYKSYYNININKCNLVIILLVVEVSATKAIDKITFLYIYHYDGSVRTCYIYTCVYMHSTAVLTIATSDCGSEWVPDASWEGWAARRQGWAQLFI